MSDFEDRYKKWHTYMSYIKSALRIASCVLVLWSPITDVVYLIGVLALGFLLAELVGIAEEWV